MGNIGNMLGIGGGGNSGGAGMKYEASGAPILPGVTQGQIENAYGQTQSGLQQQQAFINALAAQNGLGNQTNVFAQQQALANQLGDMGQGGGPNPAGAQLAQATANNVAQQNALMAGQRGANANVGMIARQAAMQGENAQQQAAGQAATMRAQQQLAAIGQQASQQQALANTANSQIGQQANSINSYNEATQNSQSNLLGGLNQYNANNVAMQGNINNANAGVSGITAQNQGKLQGSALQMGFSALMGARGGMVPCYSDGGDIDMATMNTPPEIASENNGNSGEMLKALAPIILEVMNQGGSVPCYADGGMLNNGPSMVTSFLQGLNNYKHFNSDPGINSSLMSGGPSIANVPNWEPMKIPQKKDGGGGTSSVAPLTNRPGQVMTMNKGGKLDLKAGGKVNGGKAPVPGDDLRNDTVLAKLSPKEIVIPRSITMGPNAPQKAAEFVAAILARKGRMA